MVVLVLWIGALNVSFFGCVGYGWFVCSFFRGLKLEFIGGGFRFSLLTLLALFAAAQAFFSVTRTAFGLAAAFHDDDKLTSRLGFFEMGKYFSERSAPKNSMNCAKVFVTR